jgi:hypothetical protein
MKPIELDVADLVSYFEDAEDASYTARENSERDRDYYDGQQLTAEELAAYRKRRQPPIIINRIKRKIDFLKGYEQQQRVKPRVLPRTPAHEFDADGAEQALRYIADECRYNHKRSRAWDNLIVEGMCGIEVGIEIENDEVDIEIRNVPWDRMFYDPHSSASDFSDAGYLGMVRWVDLDDAIAQYPDKKDELEATITNAGLSNTYEDRPHYKIWGDKKRRRVRICQIWLKKDEEWIFAEFTKGGLLKHGPSPFKDDEGESDCGLIFASAYINRDNERYGIVREMIGPQDEINKRRSKSLHLLNTNSVIAEEGAVRDVEKARREMARPDGWVSISPGYTDKINIQTRLDLANGHLNLLQEAKNEIDMIAGNIALQGNGINDQPASGRAIIASQQGGAMEIAPMMDALRDLDLRVFRAVWNRIRQFWDKEKWVRVTDDERNIKWLGLNADPMQVQMMAQQDPQFGQKVAGVVANLAQLDCDIIIDEAPDGISNQLEQFQNLVQLKQMDTNNELPFRAILEAMPNLRNKEQIFAKMDEAATPGAQAAQMQQQLVNAKTQAETQDKQAAAQLKQAQAAQLAYGGGEQSGPIEDPRLAYDRHMMDMEKGRAEIDHKDAQTFKVTQEAHLMPVKLQNERMHQSELMQNNAIEADRNRHHQSLSQLADQHHQANTQRQSQMSQDAQFNAKLQADAQARKAQQSVAAKRA